MTNKKTAVIEWLFFNKAKPNKAKDRLTRSVMTFDDIVEGIDAAGDGLSSRNPANFWKDITRKDPNGYWPPKVANAGTGPQIAKRPAAHTLRGARVVRRRKPAAPGPCPNCLSPQHPTKSPGGRQREDGARGPLGVLPWLHPRE
jgi:hypothetical protein